MKYYLGIDTSNYTTSMAVSDEEGNIIKNCKCPLKVKEGEKGLRQSDAVFAHTLNIPELVRQIGPFKFEAVGYSAFPRDEEGSYMPCFCCGGAAAHFLSEINNIPLYQFSHQAGHIRAAIYSAGCNDLLKRDFVAFHVSGGTTEVLYVSQNNKIKLLGGTLDLNAGQAVDRIGVMLGLKFPCGPQLEEMARGYKAPKPKICVNGYTCNFSGLENIAAKMLSDGISQNIIAAYAIDFIKLTIDKLAENVRNDYPHIPLLFAGGVMSNTIIKEYITDKYKAYFAEPQFSSDNAAGIALLTKERTEIDKIERN